MIPDLQILGLCRFSIPSEGGFQTARGTPEQVRALLYDPARLDRRLAWFEHVTLPGLRRQEDPDFTLVLLTGADLPEPWRSHLLGLVADVPQIVVETTSPGPHRALCAAALRPHVRPDARLLAQFRLDDDDAVSARFTRRLREDIAPVRGLLDRRRQFVVDYGKGIVLSWQDGFLSAEARYARQWTPGLVLVNRPGDESWILDYDHSRLWWYQPVVSWTDEIMWVRGQHAGNDSHVPPAGRDRIEMPPARLDRLLERNFGVDTGAFGRRLLGLDGPGPEEQEEP